MFCTACSLLGAPSQSNPDLPQLPKGSFWRIRKACTLIWKPCRYCKKSSGGAKNECEPERVWRACVPNGKVFPQRHTSEESGAANAVSLTTPSVKSKLRKIRQIFRIAIIKVFSAKDAQSKSGGHSKLFQHNKRLIIRYNEHTQFYGAARINRKGRIALEKQEQNSICREIGARTGGDIYIGVVGPVRSGKSTFIKRFMEQLVLPAMSGSAAARERARDELPQSAAGRTIMTTEPKFIPETAVPLQLEGGGACRVRLIDCVGYMVEGAMGHEEDAKPRMVKSPWFEQEVPFDLAAETGTRKRDLEEHSTIGVVVTTPDVA